MASLPTQTIWRASLARAPLAPRATQQVRQASLLRRPHRPYTFTQLIQQSDGSTYTQRTTSPAPLYRSTKDTRNHIMWQPSMASLHNLEEDEAGRLKAFREKFGRGWDADAEEEGVEEESLMDLISGFEGPKQSAEQMKGNTANKRRDKY